MDRLLPSERSACMRSVRGKDTAPEMAVRRLVHSLGYRFRLHRKDMPGRPDLVFPGRRKVIFVNGCFWHGHKCRHGQRPSSNVQFWNAKLDRNIERDQKNQRMLRADGWSVLTIWECESTNKALESRLVRFLGPHRSISKSRQQRMLSCVETFSGAGGMALGLISAGVDVRLAFDVDRAAVETYRHNINKHARVLDIRIADGRKLLKEMKLNRLDILSGGPPCQGFSKQKRGAHDGADERNDLIMEYVRLVRETKPRAFVFENVEIFGQKRGKEIIQSVERSLVDYRIFRFFICSSDFGLAQRRGRFLMLGFHKDEPDIVPVLGAVGARRTVRDAIGGLPPPPDDCTEHPLIPNHIKCRITKRNEQRIAHVPPGGGWSDIPRHLRLDCHNEINTAKGGWPDVYGRLEWDGQCPTITAGFDSFTRGRYAHPEQHRSLTLHEGARLQGFPPTFKFHGNRYDVRVQIGNAVPPPVAKAAAGAVQRVLAGDARTPRFPVYPEGYAAQLQAAE